MDPRSTKPAEPRGSDRSESWFRDPVVVFREPLRISPARARRSSERALRVLAEAPAPRRPLAGR